MELFANSSNDRDNWQRNKTLKMKSNLKSISSVYKILAVAFFKGDNSECDLQQDIKLFDVSWLMYIAFLVHMQIEESKVNIAGTA